MKTFFQIFLLMCGVFGADEDEVKSVMEGDSITLHPDPAKIQGFAQIQWRFGDPVIAQIDEKETSYPSHTEIFRGRLQLDQTGSLTIKNMRIKHSGLYKLKIDHSAGTSDKKFSITVYESPSVIAGAEAEMKGVSEMEGDPVTLHVPQLQGDELIVWRFGDEGKLIAKADIEAKSSLIYDNDERFRDRLKLDHQTGSLIITNTRTTDSGLYKVKISSNKQTSYKRFIVTVSAVPDSGLSPAAVAGIVVAVLLVSAAAAGVMYFCRPRITNLPSQSLTVPVGVTVTLNPGPEKRTGDENQTGDKKQTGYKKQTRDEIQWLFGAEDTLIAEIKGKNREMITYLGPDEIFMNRLKLDEMTGSLTITNTTTKHSGLYTLKIRRGRETLYKKFIVYVEDEVRKITVMEGDPVTLKPDTEIQRDDEIQWLFDDKEKQTVLAEIKTKVVTKYDGTDERFRDRLKLDEARGSLSIRKSTAAHTGRYTLKIRRGTETLYNRFYIYAAARQITVMEGDPVTLNPATEINKDDLILWLFRDEVLQTVIAEIKGETREIFTYDDDVADGRFKDRLKLDETGSLTIKDTRTSHSGPYHVQITSNRGVSRQTFFVTVNDKVELKFLNEGDPVTLNSDTKIKRDDLFLWMFGAQDDLIAQIKGGTVETYDDGVNKRFRGRLKLDETTGSLTIRNIRAEHKGHYKLLTISSSSRRTLCMKFRVVIDSMDVSVREGEPVHLYAGLTERQTDDEIQWRFGNENSLIAEIKGGTGKIYDVPDGRFRDRLELNETGDLTIKNSTAEHTGDYKLQILSSEGNTNRTFFVIIRARGKSEMKEKKDSTENRVSESATVEMPLLNGDDLDVVNEEEGTSSL